MVIRFLSVALTLFSISQFVLAQDGSFSYRTLITSTSGVDCATNAKALSERFHQATGAEIVSSSCQGSETVTDQAQTYQLDIVIVNYNASREVQPYQAVFSGRVFENHALGDSGIFPSYTSCLQAIDQQKSNFETNTGLTLVASHCDASSDSALPGFYLTLESFGEPKKQLYAYAEDQGSAIFYLDPAIPTAEGNAITKAGGTISWSDGSRFYYYADENIDVQSLNIGLFDSADICAQQKQAAEDIFTKAGVQSVTVLCAQYFSAAAPQHELSVVGAGPRQWEQDYGYNSAKYASLNECLTDKDRALQNLAGDSVLGGLCIPVDSTTGKFVIEIYTKN